MRALSSFRPNSFISSSAREFLKPNFRSFRAFSSSTSSWINVDPEEIGKSGSAYKLSNLVGGKWQGSKKYWDLIDPMNGKEFIKMPDTQIDEIGPFVKSLKSVPKSGQHNPFKKPERYQLYAEVCHRAAVALDDPKVEDYFIKCIQRVMPKSRTQAYQEVLVSRVFLKTFAGDSVRFMAQGFMVAGDRTGQQSNGYRWPFGPVALITPFNFPLEIPVLQLLGCLFMGNKPVVKGSEKTSFVLEQFVRLLIGCGMPAEDLDLIHCHGETMERLILDADVRLTQFTGSSKVADRLAVATKGKVKIEDAGFDWKILGPDADKSLLDFVAHTSDQDAYAMSGQKCSAQSILFAHKNWVQAGIFKKIEQIASTRSLASNTISPVLSVNNKTMKAHIDALLKLPGAKLQFGGELSTKEKHNIPEIYGSYLPTAVYVPIDSILSSAEAFKLCTTEIFGPFQVLTEFGDNDVDKVIECCERMSHHLTAAVVSNDQYFLHKVLGNTVNGTTYAGLRARTTGAPSNHWFGPCGDPRGAGIGTPEAVRLVWSSHREIITDYLAPKDFKIPAPH